MKKIILSLIILCIAISANAFDPKSKPVQVIMPFASEFGTTTLEKTVRASISRLQKTK
jgi:hypothetical protein